MKTIQRLIYFFSIFLTYFVFKEFLELFVLTHSIHPAFGYTTLAILIGFVAYFVLIPIYKILKIPKNYTPTKDKNKASKIIQERVKKFKKNPHLLKTNFDFSEINEDEEGYNHIIKHLQTESEKLRKKSVLQLFYSSSISQNGFLDAMLILSSSVNLVKELFVLYHGRVTNKDLIAIAKRVYLSMAIGGSEGVEYATQEFFSKFATDSFKSIPFADKIFGSLADGFVNAALLTRISLITENYCTLVFITSERDVYPSSAFILKTTKFITSDIFEKMTVELLRMSKEKTLDYVMLAINPVAHLFTATYGKVAEGTSKLTAYPIEIIKDAATIANRPLVYGLNRLGSMFKRKR